MIGFAKQDRIDDEQRRLSGRSNIEKNHNGLACEARQN